MSITPAENSNELKPEEKKTSEKWWTTVGIGIGVFIFALDVYIVNLALPVMVESLHTSFATSQWIVLSYLLAIAIFVILVSKLGDIWNKKRLYIIGLTIFTISSLLCGMAQNVGFLIAFRGLQGIGAAFLSGLGTAMIVEAFPAAERGLGLGIRAGIYGMGITLGPMVGGLLMSVGGWPLIFWVNVPIGIFAILIVACFVPNSAISGNPENFDIIGTLILTIVLTSFILGITLLQKGNSHIAINMLGFSVVSLIGFLWFESRIAAPMIDLKIFRSVEFSLGLTLRLIANFAIAGVIFILPFFFTFLEHYSTQKSGFLMVVPSLLIVTTAPIAGILSDRFGTQLITSIGLVFMAIGCFLISRFDTELTVIKYILGIIPYGVGVAMFNSPNNSSIMGAAPKERLGIASGLLSFSRILGQMLGVPIVGALFFFTTSFSANFAPNIDISNAPVQALLFATHTTFLVLGVLLIVSTMFATWFWWIENKKAALL